MKCLVSLAGAILAAFLSGCSDGDTGHEFSTLAELERAHVRYGIEEGTFAERLAHERFKDCECMPTFGPIVPFPALEKGLIDAIVFDRPFLEYAAMAHPEFKLLDENLGLGEVVIGTKLGNDALMAQVNAFIHKIREDGTFTVKLIRNGNDLTMIFIDGGKAFNPLADAPEPDVKASADKRGIGGLGIYMVKKMSKAVSYARVENQNVLTVTVAM